MLFLVSRWGQSHWALQQMGKRGPREGEPLPSKTAQMLGDSSPLSWVPMWPTWPESAGPREVLTRPCLTPAFCAGELAGLRQQIANTEEKAALDKELMAQKLAQAEREAQASLREQRAAHEEDLQRLHREKV